MMTMKANATLVMVDSEGEELARVSFDSVAQWENARGLRVGDVGVFEDGRAFKVIGRPTFVLDDERGEEVWVPAIRQEEHEKKRRQERARRENVDRMAAMLRELEWAGEETAYSQAEWAACPECGAVKPSQRKDENSWNGPHYKPKPGTTDHPKGPAHEPGCRLRALLDEIDGGEE